MKRTILAFLAITVLEGAMGATSSVTAQWPGGSPRAPGLSLPDGRDHALGAGSSSMNGHRLRSGPVDLGARVASRKLLVNLDPSGGRAGAGSTSIYHGFSLKF